MNGNLMIKSVFSIGQKTFIKSYLRFLLGNFLLQAQTLCDDKLNDEGEADDIPNTLDLDANASKSTIIVKFRGAIDVILSPVFLESVQVIFQP